MQVALDAGMSVIACIGEKLEERERGETMAVLAAQLAAIKTELTETDWERVNFFSYSLLHTHSYPCEPGILVSLQPFL